MAIKFEFKLYHLILQIIFIYIKQIKFYKCICDKDNPIKKNNNCQSIYCTENEFQSNICLIDNDIIKTQWLNNFIDFKEYRYRFTSLLTNEDGDLILFSSPEELNGQRLIFRIKKNGKPYYKNNNNEEIFSKNKIVLDGDYNGALRYESQVFLIKVNNDNYDENKQFLVSISLYYGFMEIYDIDDNDIPFSIVSVRDFGDYIIYSTKGSVIELDNKEYLYFFAGQSYKDNQYRYVLKKYKFFDINLNKENINEKCIIEDKKLINIGFSRIQCAFKTEQNQIILFYVNIHHDFVIEVLHQNYTTLYQKYLGKPDNYNFDENSVFLKGINLKENIGIFLYYNDTKYYHPKILICEIDETDLINKFDFELEEYEYNTDPLLNDIIKLNNKRFSFISSSPDRLILYIVLFDLYNNNQNIKIRFYKINIYNLYNYKIHKELSSILYNNFLALSLSVCNSLQCEDKEKDSFFTTLLIFSYINGTDYNINITSYFSGQENNDNDDINLNFPNDLKIDNNIFGYQINQQIKIISIPNEINLYKIENDNSKTQIQINDEYSPDMKLMISPKNDVIRTDATYYIEYQYQYSEPDYDTFNQYSDIRLDYPEDITVDQKTEFNNDRQIYEKIFKIEFKLCNDYCKTCKSIGKSNKQTKCEECQDDLKYYLDDSSNSNTCFPKNEDCPSDSPFLIIDNIYKCQKSCGIEDFKNNKCILDNSSTESLNTAYGMFKDLISTQYNNEDIVLITDDNLTFHLSNSQKEKTNLENGKGGYYNLSIIDLGECETKLKTANGISPEVPLIIFKKETYYENTTIKNVQYEIYNPLTGEQIKDLSPCDEEKINIYVSTNLDDNEYILYQELKNQGYDLYDPNDKFYNDICTKYATVNNTDLTLSDRKELLYDNSKIFCQENCDYKGIDSKTSLAKCECSASSSEITFEKKQFSGIEIITSFYEVIKFSNFLILKCYNLVFSSLGIKNNYGFAIMVIYLTSLLVMFIIFLFTGMKKIKDQLSKMIYCSINKLNTVSTGEKKNEKINDLKHTIFPPAPKKKRDKKRKNKSPDKKKYIGYNFKNKQKKSISESLRKNSSSWKLNSKKRNINLISKKRKTKADLSLKVHSKIREANPKYSEFELDDLEYLEAIKYDKRTLFQFYMCLVKREHLIVFTFIFCSDLNLLCIKLSLFVFSLSLDFCTNVLFFNDDSMHKIYLDYGKYNFVSQIPQIVYSTVISETFDVFLKYLSLSEKEIYEAKQINNMDIAVEEVKKIIRKIKLKFFFFFLVCFVLMSFFFYFITAFCAVYENTQDILIKDTIFSLVISLLYPFILYFIPAILRIIALRSSKKDQRLLYKISNIFPLF